MTGGEPNVSSDPLLNPVTTELITVAFQILAVINEDETPTAGMYKMGIRTLNSMVKELEATGIHVWTEEEAILFLQPLQARYLLGGQSTPDHACDANSYALSQVSDAVAQGATSIPLLDTTGFDAGDQIGILMDSGYNFWTTVSAAPANGLVPITDPITGSASINNWSYAYETNLLRPLRVPFSRRLAFDGFILSPLRMMSRQEYFNLPNPEAPGTPTQAYYNPARDQGEYFVWPVTNAGSLQNSNAMRFTYYRPIFNFTSPNSTADLPSEWTNALEWNLAAELAPRYSVPQVRFDRVLAQAAVKLDLVRGWDREDQDIYFGMDMDETVRR